MAEFSIDQAFLERLERLTLHWQKSFPGLVGGHNASRYPGAGQEFLDHRQFHQGDDLRAVNWRVYMRLERLILKLFQVEPRVPVRILLDTSDSMATGEPNKFDYARRLAGALTYVGLVRLESVLLQPFANQLLDPLPCGGGRHRFRPTVTFLEGLKPSGKSDFLAVVKRFIAEYPQRGLVIVISDFLDDQGCENPSSTSPISATRSSSSTCGANRTASPPFSAKSKSKTPKPAKSKSLTSTRKRKPNTPPTSTPTPAASAKSPNAKAANTPAWSPPPPSNRPSSDHY